jgi:hypothetical protein
MQQFHKFITWCLCVAQHVSAISRRGLADRDQQRFQPLLSNNKTRGS